jgi:hypothetical protein
MDIAGKVFIVTGGASGLGEGTARMLAANGAKVVIADLQVERGEAVAKEIGGVFVKCDVSQEADGQAVVAAATAAGQADGPGELRRHRAGREDRGQGRRPPAGHLHQDHHGQPGGQLQHDPPGRRGHVQEPARAHRRARRDDQHRQRGRLRRPDRPGRLCRQQGRRGGHDAAHRARPGAQRHPQHDHRPGHLRHADAVLDAAGGAGRAGRRRALPQPPGPARGLRQAGEADHRERHAQRRGDPAGRRHPIRRPRADLAPK